MKPVHMHLLEIAGVSPQELSEALNTFSEKNMEGVLQDKNKADRRANFSLFGGLH